MFEFKRLQDIATIYNDRRITVRGTERLLRRGPYPLYVETGTVPFDDFFFDGSFIVLGSLCNVENERGCFAAQKATGKFAVTDLYHVLACDNEADTCYLREVLSRIPVRGRADAGGQSMRLSENSLRYLPIPWPEQEARQGFTAFVDAHRQRMSAIGAQQRNCLETGLALLDEALSEDGVQRYQLDDLCEVIPGRGLDARDRKSEGRYAVVSSQGVLGHTDERGIDDPCFVVGQAGQFLLGRLMERGTFPLSDSAALVMRDGAPLSLDSLSFALARLGVRKHLRVIDRQVDALAMPLERIGELEIELPAAESLYRLAQEHRKLVEQMIALEKKRSEANRKFADTVNQFMEGSEEAVAVLKVPALSLAEQLTNEAYADLKATSGNATHFDAAWEVIPLVAARAIAGAEAWDAIAEADSPAATADTFLQKVLADDEGCRDVLHLLGNGSVLSSNTRSELVRHLAMMPVSEDFGAMMRWLAQAFQPVSETSGDNGPLWKSAVPAPAVVSLVSSLGARLAPKAATAYDPMALTGEVLSSLARKLPAVRAQGATRQYADLLASNLASRCSGIEEFPLAISAGPSENVTPELFDLVVSILPCNEGEWSPIMPQADDPRWQFGVPPRNKANLAWLQHAYALRAAGGFAVLATANATLHESRGSEPVTRAALISSGCVYAVIALPGRLFDNGRAPMSVIVLGDRRENPSCETLFVNLLDRGIERPAHDVDGHHAPRLLSQNTINEVVETVASWAADGTVILPAYARVVPQAEIAARNVLTPWTYVA